MDITLKKTNLFIILLIFLSFMTIYTLSNYQIDEIIKQIKLLPYLIKVLAMISLIALQIFLAFLPGEPLELASGYIFGSFEGTIICLIGSMIGTVIVYYLARLFQYTIIDKMFSASQIAEVQKLFSSKKSKFWLFVILLIPGSPKDIITYLVSLGDIELKHWVLLATIGRIPSIVTSTYLVGSLKEGKIILAGFIFLITIILVVGGAIYYKKIVNS